MSDLAICKLLHWPYEYLMELPADVYDVLIEELQDENSVLRPSLGD